MATGGITDISVERIAAAPTGGVTEIHVTRTPPAPDPPVGGIAALWVTRGYSPPVTDGGWQLCLDGATWSLYRMRVVHTVGTWS